MIDDIDVTEILVSKKKNNMVKKGHPNTSLGKMMMMSLDQYA